MKKKTKLVIIGIAAVLTLVVVVSGLGIATDSVLRDETKAKIALQESEEGKIVTSDETVILDGGTVTDNTLYGALLGNSTKRTPGAYSADLTDYMPYTTRGTVRNVLSEALHAEGSQLNLTVSNDYQKYVHNILSTSEKTKYYDTACVVMENKTGKVRVFYSRKGGIEDGTINWNDMSEIYSYVNYINSTLPEGQTMTLSEIYPDLYTNECLLSTSTGSTAKIITAVPVIEEGLQDEYIETEARTEVGSGTIGNSDDAYYGSINLQQALVNSVNTYFIARYRDTLGWSTLSDIMERYLIGTDTFKSDIFSVSSAYSDSSEFAYAQSSFGQGVEATPLQMAATIAAYSNEGQIIRPVIVDSVISGEDTVFEAKTEIMTQACTKETADLMKTYLYAVGAAKGHSDLMLKTGTAETDYNGRICWVVASDGDYSCVVRIRSNTTYKCTSLYGASIVDVAAEILAFAG